MFCFVYGPFRGTANDLSAYTQVNMESKLRHLFVGVNQGRADGDQVCAAADSAFLASDVMQVRHTGAVLSAAEEHYNKRFSKVRIAIEWSFGLVFTD